MDRYCLQWSALRAVEPSAEEVQAHAAQLAGWYNEPVNRALMTNDELTAAEVVEGYRGQWSCGDRTFLFFSGDALVGDGDLRDIDGGEAGCAVLIGPRDRQGQGLGTRFTAMMLAFAFGPLGLRRVFASVLPENAASLRMFEKLGFRVDRSPGSRRHADANTDVCLSADAAPTAEVRISLRG